MVIIGRSLQEEYFRLSQLREFFLEYDLLKNVLIVIIPRTQNGFGTVRWVSAHFLVSSTSYPPAITVLPDGVSPLLSCDPFHKKVQRRKF